MAGIRSAYTSAEDSQTQESTPPVVSSNSKKQVRQVVHPPAHREFSAGVLHDFLNPLAVIGPVAVLGAVLALGLGVHRAEGPFDQGVCQQLLTARAQPGLSARKFLQVMGFQFNGFTIGVVVVALTVDLDELHEGLQVSDHLRVIIFFRAEWDDHGGCLVPMRSTRL